LAKRSAARSVNARKESGNRLVPEAPQGLRLEPLRPLFSRRHPRHQLVEAGEHDPVVPPLVRGERLFELGGVLEKLGDGGGRDLPRPGAVAELLQIARVELLSPWFSMGMASIETASSPLRSSGEAPPEMTALAV
jgi:hypothetical protein